MTGIGALVITRNEARGIEACLRSLAFCDQRVLVDSFSEDDTVARAMPLADAIYQRTFTAWGEQKNWGLDQLTTPWALVVDADERVPLELAGELVELARRGDADGYWIFRRNRFFGRTMRGAGWSRDRVLRFFRRELGRYDARAVHEEVVLTPGARAGTCAQRLDHHSYNDWEETFQRLTLYSTRGAADAAAAGKGAPLGKLVGGPPARFVRQYLAQAGFRDGVHGLVLCGLGGVGTFLKLAKLRLGETQLQPVGAAGDGGRRLVVAKGPAPRGGDGAGAHGS